MARKECSKSVTAKATTATIKAAGDVKPLTPFTPGIGEYVLKAREVVKLAKTLQERILTVAQTFREYNQSQYTTADREDYDRRRRPELWEALCDARTEVEKVLQETLDAFVGLYDAMTSPPAGFKEVAVALMGVVGAVKGISEKGISQVPSVQEVPYFLSPLDIATKQLHATVSEVTQRLFHFIPSTIPNSEYSTDGSSFADRYCDRMAAVAARYGVDIKKLYGTNWLYYGTNWLQVLNVLQAKDPDAPEWKFLSEECDELHVEYFVEKAVLRYLERTDDERRDAENDANYRQLAEALQAALPPLTPQSGETKEQTAKKEDVRLRIAVYLLELAKSDVKSGLKSSHIDKAVAIINGTDTIKEKMLALEQIPIFAKLTDNARVSSRVVANLLGCTHPAVGNARKPLKGEVAEVTRAEKQGRGLSGAGIDGTSKKAASGREDFDEDKHNDSVDLAADKLSIVCKDTVRKGARSKKYDPDAKHDREADDWLKKHGG